jgi:hypothetical protein
MCILAIVWTLNSIYLTSRLKQGRPCGASKSDYYHFFTEVLLPRIDSCFFSQNKGRNLTIESLALNAKYNITVQTLAESGDNPNASAKSIKTSSLLGMFFQTDILINYLAFLVRKPRATRGHEKPGWRNRGVEIGKIEKL